MHWEKTKTKKLSKTPNWEFFIVKMSKEIYTENDLNMAEVTEIPLVAATEGTFIGCDCPHPIEPYFGVFASELKRREQGPGIMLEIPPGKLFGTQRLDEYIPSKSRSVSEKLHKCGINCLREHPPLACALFEPGSVILAVIDGHHRIRNLGKMEAKPVRTPVLILTVEELSSVLTGANPHMTDKFTPNTLEKKIREDIISTLASFRNMPDKKQPEPIIGIGSMQDLQQRYSPSPKTVL
ncbi:MAG: hypothetical protein COY68_02195 [Candidatus Levybacteria bacterium CG_4_10_14_0_8_um_filter_35_23]|nr:MAG: hypothetical protein COY68_02195 [Candidatus Levybacteria bacterium CG_4_10_14_0_8_um_filter_35_23]